MFPTYFAAEMKEKVAFRFGEFVLVTIGPSKKETNRLKLLLG
jgi:hypothetical protein